MPLRDTALTLGALLLLAAAAVVLFGSPSTAGELPPPVAGPELTPDDHREPEAIGGAVAKSEVAVVDPVFRRSDAPDTTGWTTGVIRGDIPLTPTVLAKIESIAVVVDELKNPRGGGAPPYRKVVAVPLGIGTPTFEIPDVPFSDYGYVVRVHCPGLNGGQATVALTKDHPLADGLQLAITPGCAFSLRLRDQDLAAVAFTEVRMVPTGEPFGRPRHDGRTDNFGSVVFEDVLAGDYQVFIGSPTQPLIPPPTITVQPGAWLVQGGVIQPQGLALSVPRGMPVDVAVVDRAGYPVRGARVRMQSTDRAPRVVELREETDVHGRVHWPNVLAGQWEIEVTMADHQITQKQLTIKDGENPPEQQFTLVRLR